MGEHCGKSHLRRDQDDFVAFGYHDPVPVGWEFEGSFVFVVFSVVLRCRV